MVANYLLTQGGKNTKTGFCPHALLAKVKKKMFTVLAQTLIAYQTVISLKYLR
jgi:hypothetical protein